MHLFLLLNSHTVPCIGLSTKFPITCINVYVWNVIIWNIVKRFICMNTFLQDTLHMRFIHTVHTHRPKVQSCHYLLKDPNNSFWQRNKTSSEGHQRLLQHTNIPMNHKKCYTKNFTRYVKFFSCWALLLFLSRILHIHTHGDKHCISQ